MGEKAKVFGKLPQILTFPFKGEGWFGKLAIATGIMLAGYIIPILPMIILLGYFYEMVRRVVIEGEDAKLPEWDDWGGFLSNGFKWFASTLVITVPFFVVFFLTMSLYFVPIFFMETGVGEELFAGYFAFLFFAQFILMFVSIIFMVFMGVFAPVYMVHMVAEGNFKAMFQIKGWWKIFAKGFWEFFISFLLLYGIAMIVGMVYGILIYSLVCCCLAPIVICFGSVYLMAVYMALVAGAYRDGRDKMPVVDLSDDDPLPLDDGSVEEPEVLLVPEPVVEEDATLVADEPSVEEVVAAAGVTAPLVMPDEAVSPEEVAEEVEEEYDLPSPDGDMAEEMAEDVESIPTPDTAETMVSMEVEDVVEEDATIVSGVNEAIAKAMGYSEATVKMDDLKKIRGIGPKTADVLKQNGIMNFEQLSNTSEEALRQILTENGLEIVAAACGDWAQQAKDMR